MTVARCSMRELDVSGARIQRGGVRILRGGWREGAGSPIRRDTCDSKICRTLDES